MGISAAYSAPQGGDSPCGKIQTHYRLLLAFAGFLGKVIAHEPEDQGREIQKSSDQD
jgi:hypothetical protein